MEFYQQVRYGRSVPEVYGVQFQATPRFRARSLYGLGAVTYAPIILNGLAGLGETSYDDKLQFLKELEDLEASVGKLDAQVIFRRGTDLQDRLMASQPWEYTSSWFGTSIPASSDLNLRVGAVRTKAAAQMNQNQIASEKKFQGDAGTSKFIDDAKSRPALVQNAEIVSEDLKNKGSPLEEMLKREYSIAKDAGERTIDDFSRGPFQIIDKLGPWKWVVYGGVALVAAQALGPFVSALSGSKK